MPDAYAKKKGAAKDADDVHAEALKRYERGFNRDRVNQDKAYEDLRFLAGDAQWEDRALKEREAQSRPILVANETPQFVRQVTGDIRQLRPAIKVVPIDDDASKEIAEKILPGMIRYIEQRSDASGAYFGAADSQVASGIGHWRVLHEYANDSTFEQEIRIAPIDDGIGVVWDSDSTLPTREDAKCCFVPIDMSRASFEEAYPDALSGAALPGSAGLFHAWFTDDSVRVAEYWEKVPYKRKIAQMPDGSIKDLDSADKAEIADVEAAGGQIEERDGYRINRYVMSASEFLEGPEEWPGLHIPIVPLIGEEIKIGREIVRRGVVRQLKDVQRLYNYAISAYAEVVALQPKAPYKGTRKNFEKYQDQWETANSKNWPYLEYEPDPANGGAAPQREPPPVASSAIAELLTISKADMSAVTGIYPAALGAKSNEVSGKAILARQREGDTGTYVYIDNFSRAIRRTGQILLDLIPHIYDTERTIQIVGEDGKIDEMQINAQEIDPNGDGILTRVLNDLTIGTYEVAIEMGPSYSTKREEARDGMQALMQALGPEVGQMFIDLFVKAQDWPLADKIAKRAQMLLPPAIQQMEAQEAGEPPPPMPPPPQPSPEQMAALQQQAHEQEMDKSKLILDDKKINAELARASTDLQVAQMNDQTTRLGHLATVTSANTTNQPAQNDNTQVNGAANGAGTGGDQRIDVLTEAVAQLRDVVVQLADWAASKDGPPEPPPDAGIVPSGPGGPAMPPQALPPGGLPPGPSPPIQ